MKIDLNHIEKSLNDFKDVFLGKIKDSEDATSEKINSIGKELDEKIKAQMAEWKKRKMSLPGLEDEAELKNFSIAKVVQAQLNVKGFDGVSDSDFEREVCEKTFEISQRSTNAGTGAAGGFLIPEEVSGMIIDLAIAKTPVFELGVDVIRGLRGELPIPKTTGRPTMYWVGEEEAPTESNTTFGEITLRPKTAAAFTKISRRVLHQTNSVAERIVRNELVKSFRIGLDTAIISGTGVSNQPKGIVNYSNLTATSAVEATNGGRFRIDKAAQMSTNIDVANMLNGKLGYLMRPEVKSGMLRERIEQWDGQSEDQGQPIHPGSVMMSQSELEATLGYKLRTTTLLPANIAKGSSTTLSQVIFGDWSQVIVGMWEGFEIKASDTAGDASGSAMTQRQIWLSAFQGVDVNVKDESGLTIISDAETLEASW